MVGIAAAIGPAMKALEKVKAKSWKAMEGAMQEVKAAASPMDSMRASLAFITPVMKVIGSIFKLLGASILQSSLDSIKVLLDLLTDPETLTGTQELGNVMGEVVIPVVQALTSVFQALGPMIVGVTTFLQENAVAFGILKVAVAPMANLLNLITTNFQAIKLAWYALSKFLWDWANRLTWGLWGKLVPWDYSLDPSPRFDPDTRYHGGRQYGGDIKRTGYYRLHKDEKVIKAGETNKKEIHIHIDLRNAVVDNVDRLASRIAEQVLIQIG